MISPKHRDFIGSGRSEQGDQRNDTSHNELNDLQEFEPARDANRVARSKPQITASCSSMPAHGGGVTNGPPAVSAPFVDTYVEADQQHFARRC
jgi:hypothetical protein